MITTIIPTYKRPQLLKRAIKSALYQTYAPVQVKVYDDASGDDTEAVVREFMKKDSRVSYHGNPCNIGLIKNYQLSMSEVTTPYFSFLSDDDALLPWFYEETLTCLQKYPDCVFAAGSTIIMTNEGKVVAVPLEQWTKSGYILAKEGCLEMIAKYPVPTCVLFQRKLLDQIFIDEKNVLTWDCDFLLQAAASHPIFISKRPCGLFLHHEASYSNAQQLKHWQQSLLRMKKRVSEDPYLEEEAKQGAIELIHRDLKLKYIDFIRRAIFAKKFQEAYSHLRELKKDYGKDKQTHILSLVLAFSRWVPIVFYSLLLLRKVKKKRRANTYRHYEQYAKYLKLADEG